MVVEVDAVVVVEEVLAVVVGVVLVVVVDVVVLVVVLVSDVDLKLIMNDPLSSTLYQLTPVLDRRQGTPPHSPPGDPPHCWWRCCTRG